MTDVHARALAHDARRHHLAAINEEATLLAAAIPTLAPVGRATPISPHAAHRRALPARRDPERVIARRTGRCHRSSARAQDRFEGVSTEYARCVGRRPPQSAARTPPAACRRAATLEAQRARTADA